MMLKCRKNRGETLLPENNGESIEHMIYNENNDRKKNELTHPSVVHHFMEN